MLASRTTLTLLSPAPFTSVISGIASIASVTASTSSGLTAATISRSPTVSRLLLALPASCACSTPSILATIASNASPYSSPTFSRLRPWNRASKSIPSRIFCWLFSPNPSRWEIASSLHAAESSSIESIPNSSYNCLIRFGPSPGIASISIIPGGVSSYSDCKSPHVPSPRDSAIRAAIPLPIPLTPVISPDSLNSHKSCSSEAMVRLPFSYALILKGFASFNLRRVATCSRTVAT